jgi:hypothetical protein
MLLESFKTLKIKLKIEKCDVNNTIWDDSTLLKFTKTSQHYHFNVALLLRHFWLRASKCCISLLSAEVTALLCHIIALFLF